MKGTMARAERHLVVVRARFKCHNGTLDCENSKNMAIFSQEHGKNMASKK